MKQEKVRLIFRQIKPYAPESVIYKEKMMKLKG